MRAATRVVFFGTPRPAAVALKALMASRHAVVAVVTQPDRPRGRSGAAQPSPVKELAVGAGLPVLQPETPREAGFAEELARFQPDVSAVVAYGHILPPEVLAVPAKGFVNVHFSLLPRYRGAAPVQRAVMAGETETGVTTFLLEPTLDTGPILMAERAPIDPDDTAGTLMERLAGVGARLLVRTLDALEAGMLDPQPQNPAEATPAPKVRPEDGAIDWSRSTKEIADLIRGLNPSPGAFTTFRGKRLKVWRARPAEAGAEAKQSPGTLMQADQRGAAVRTGDGMLELLEVQLEGGKRLDAAAFVRGQRIEFEREVLGN